MIKPNPVPEPQHVAGFDAARSRRVSTPAI
jgi:hypothetical protein